MVNEKNSKLQHDEPFKLSASLEISLPVHHLITFLISILIVYGERLQWEVNDVLVNILFIYIYVAMIWRNRLAI